MSGFAPLRPELWDDPDFRDLTVNARLLYMMLFSNRKLSRCGVLDLMPDRWSATLAFDVTDALAELEATRFVVVDRATFETLVRTKVKHDPPKSWQQTSAVWKAWQQVDSAELRRVIVEHMPGSAWEHRKAPAPVDKPGSDRGGDTPSDTHSDTPSDRASHTPLRADTCTSTCTDTCTSHRADPPLRPVDSPPSDEDERVQQALELLAHRRAGNGPKTPKYLARIIENMRGDEALDVDAARLCADFPTAPASLIAQRLEGDPCPNLAHYRAESA